MSAVRRAAGCALAALLGCGGEQGPADPARELPAGGTAGRVALGDLAGVGPAGDSLAEAVRNPLAGSAAAREEGGRLFVQMNCADCHGYQLQGNMGPSLVDAEWRYGGAPVQVYNSIREGRPQGMPAWGDALPEGEIWKIVTYIRSLGVPADTPGGDPAGSALPPHRHVSLHRRGSNADE
ncbi:MAG TPA: c-type cytochrome [Longimicrobiaceae bacterium]